MRYFGQFVVQFSKSRRSDGKRRSSAQAQLEIRDSGIEAAPIGQSAFDRGQANDRPGPGRAATATIGDMTQLAQQMISSGKLKAPAGPTYLYLNFDGWKASPYNSNHDRFTTRRSIPTRRARWSWRATSPSRSPSGPIRRTPMCSSWAVRPA